MSKVYTLYLDKLSEPMEQMIISMCPPEVDLRFLEPNVGKQGCIEDAECLIVTTYKCTKEVIERAKNLKLIQRTGIGLDMVDVTYAKQKNIPISVCVGINSQGVAELTILFILALYRHLTTLDELTRKGEWHTWTYRHDSFDLYKKTVGIIGAGTIGKEVMKRLKGFDVEILYNDVVRMDQDTEEKYGCSYVSREELLQRSDVVSLHVPLLDSTRGMIGKKEFAMMKDNAVLINTSRSQLLVIEDLIEALNNRIIHGAALDVFHPADEPFGRTVRNLITMPHIGAATYDTYYRVYSFCLNNIQNLALNNELQCLI